MRKSANILTILSSVILVVQALNFMGVLELPYFDILSFFLLGVTIYSLDLPECLFRREPSKVLAFSKLARYGPAIFVLSGAWVANALLDSFAVFMIKFSYGQHDNQTLVQISLLVFGLSILSYLAMIFFSNRLGFYVQKDKKTYETMLRPFFVTSLFLGFGGDLFVGIGTLLTSILSRNPLKMAGQIERSFWLIWKKARGNPEIRLLFSALGIFVLTFVTNFRFVDLRQPNQIVFLALVVIPVICAYLALRTEKLERTFVLAVIVSYILWITIMIIEPEAIPIQTLFKKGLLGGLELTDINVPFIARYAFSIFYISLPLALVVDMVLSPLDYKWKSLDQDIFRSFLANLFLLAMIGLFFEIVFLPKNIEELALMLPSISNRGILPITIYKATAAGSTAVAFLAVFVFSIHDSSVIRGVLRRRRKRRIEFSYLLISVFCLAIFSILLLKADLELMSNNQASLREKAVLVFSEEYTQMTYKVDDPHLWIFLNITQIGNDLFGVSVGDSYNELTAGIINVTLKNVDHQPEVTIILVNDTGSEYGGMLSIEIYTAYSSSLAGGPLYYIHIPAYFLLIPRVYSILLRKEILSSKN